jgi:FkbH-like protein
MDVMSQRTIKCVIWDLDETIWAGTLLEDREVTLRPGIARVLGALDLRGILLSIASRNVEADAIAQLRRFGIDHYFVYPQINWNAKSSSIAAIASALNLGMSSVAFIDDQPFDREEVAHALPEVQLIAAEEWCTLADRPEMQPRFVTAESRLRREMVRRDQARREAEKAFVGPQETFLAELGMRMEIRAAREDDLQRAEELTVRTNQLNATGRTYSYEELDRFRTSSTHLLLVATLSDRFGSYGTIGLALIDCASAVWRLKLLLMSCRVMARGVGSTLLADILHRAHAAGRGLQAEFVPTDRNRMMFVTYKLGGFKEVGSEDGVKVLERDLKEVPAIPPYVELVSSVNC